MAGSGRISLVVVAAFLFNVSGVDAFNGRLGTWPSTSSSQAYYYAPPIYYYHCAPWSPNPRIVPVPDARPGYALPTPAPASTKEPPVGLKDSRLPKISTTRSLGGTAESKQMCRVGFWNMAGRDVMLSIDGKSWSLPRNQVLTFDVERNFSWQVTGQPLRTERVPEGKGTFEVLVRE